MKKAVARLEAERREARLYLNLTDPGLAVWLRSVGDGARHTSWVSEEVPAMRPGERAQHPRRPALR